MGRKNFGETLYIVFLVSGKRFLWCDGGDDGGEMEEKMEVIMVVKRVMISCERFQYVV